MLFGCGGINLPDGLFEPLPATNKSALYDLALPSCCGVCVVGMDPVLASFLSFLGVDVSALSLALLLSIWNASSSKVMGLILF